MRRRLPRIHDLVKSFDSDEELRERIGRLRDFYERGAASLREFPGRRMKHGTMKRIEEEGASGELLRKARVFADPQRGYTPAEFDELIGLCQLHRFALGTSFIIRLQSITRPNGEPDRRLRACLQRQAIKNRWSMKRLNFEIARRFGRRHAHAGRRIRTPQNLDEVKHQLSAIALRWKHLAEVIAQLAAEDLVVPGPVLRNMGEVSVAMERLTEALCA